MTQGTRSSAKTAEPRTTPVLVLLVLAVAAFAAAFAYRANPINIRAQDYAQDVATASAVTYVSLRTVNAFLSTAQEVEVGGSLVVQGTAQPFKILEPIDDTIERIASLVFTTMVVTGLLAVAMGPVSAVGAALIGGAACLWIADRLIGRRDPLLALARGLGWYGAFLALALPAAFLLSSLVADRLTAEVWAENDAVVREITAPIAPQVKVEATGFRGARDKFIEYQEFTSSIYDRTDDLIQSYIAILAVFLFKILVLPLMLTGAFYIAVRFFARRPG